MKEKELRNEPEMPLDPERVARGLGVGIRENHTTQKTGTVSCDDEKREGCAHFS